MKVHKYENYLLLNCKCNTCDQIFDNYISAQYHCNQNKQCVKHLEMNKVSYPKTWVTTIWHSSNFTLKNIFLRLDNRKHNVSVELKHVDNVILIGKPYQLWFQEYAHTDKLRKVIYLHLHLFTLVFTDGSIATYLLFNRYFCQYYVIYILLAVYLL